MGCQKPEGSLILHADSREPKTMLNLLTFCPVNIRALACGDFVLFDQDGHSLGIERKKGTDLLGSLSTKMKNGNKRLYDQVERMSVEYTHRMLVLEDPVEYEPATKTVGGWNHGAVQMILWSLWAEGTFIVYTSSKYATADLLRHLHRRAEAGCVLPHSLRVQSEELAA